MARALGRHQKGEARVIPILLRAGDYADAPFAGLQLLPRNGTAIMSWANQEEGWADVAKGIRESLQKDVADTTIVSPRRSSSFNNPECERIMEGILHEYIQMGFPPYRCCYFGHDEEERDHQLVAGYRELAAMGYLEPQGRARYGLSFIGHAVIMRNIPMSEEAKKVIKGVREEYIKHYHNHRAWYFLDAEVKETVYCELRERGYVEMGRGAPGRRTLFISHGGI